MSRPKPPRPSPRQRRAAAERARAVLRAAWPAALTGKSDDYVDALFDVLLDQGAEQSAPPESAPAPAPYVAHDDGRISIREWDAVISAYRTGAALAYAAAPRWRGQA